MATAMGMRVWVTGLVALAFGSIQAQVPPRACGVTAEPGADWPSAGFVGMGLSLRLPPTLEPVRHDRLARTARAARALGIPRRSGPAVELAAAWQAPARSGGELREVLLFMVRNDSTPPGRPCTLRIAGHDGLVFRFALSAEGRASEDHWTEAYWPGFILAAGARTLAGVDSAFALLRSITREP